MKRYPSYQLTNIPWLPEVPDGWEVCPVKSVLCLRQKVVGEESDKYDLLSLTLNGIVKRDMENPTGKFPASFDTYQEVCEGDFVFCLFDNEETPRTVGLSALHGMITGAYDVLRPCVRNFSSPFLNYYFLYIDDRKRLKPLYRGMRKTIPFNSFMSSKVPLPPLETQERIVAFLDAQCGKIDKLVAAKAEKIKLLKEYRERLIADAVTRGIPGKNTAFKSTTIPWLPEVPEGWEVKKVRQHFTLRSEKVSDKDYAALSVAKIGVVPQLDDVAISFAEGNSRKLVRKGDFVVNSRSDRKGSCGIAPRDGSVTTISIVLEPHDINRAYVHYLFRSIPWVEEFYRNGRGIVADLWTTRHQEMKNMMFPFPPLETQERIVAFLDARCGKIDKLVAAKTEKIKLLKEYRERLIADVVTRGIPGKNTAFKSTTIPWLPEIPEGWEVRRLKSLLREQRDLSTTGEELPLSLTAKEGIIPFADKANRTMESSSYIGAKKVFKGQIVFNRFKARLFAISDYDGLVSPDYAVFTPGESCATKYLVTLFNTAIFRQRLNLLSSGVGDGFSRVYASDLFQLYIPFPPLEEQKQIVAYIEEKTQQIDALVGKLDEEIVRLKEYRERLIADVVTGQQMVE